MRRLNVIRRHQKPVGNTPNTITRSVTPQVTAAQVTTAQVTTAQVPDSLSKLDTQKYRHYKGGEYLVFGEGIHTETEEDLVFYCSTEDWKLYARPKAMFYSDIEWNGETRNRFTLID